MKIRFQVHFKQVAERAIQRFRAKPFPERLNHRVDPPGALVVRRLSYFFIGDSRLFRSKHQRRTSCEACNRRRYSMGSVGIPFSLRRIFNVPVPVGTTPKGPS